MIARTSVYALTYLSMCIQYENIQFGHVLLFHIKRAPDVAVPTFTSVP